MSSLNSRSKTSCILCQEKQETIGKLQKQVESHGSILSQLNSALNQSKEVLLQEKKKHSEVNNEIIRNNVRYSKALSESQYRVRECEREKDKLLEQASLHNVQINRLEAENAILKMSLDTLFQKMPIIGESVIEETRSFSSRLLAVGSPSRRSIQHNDPSKTPVSTTFTQTPITPGFELSSNDQPTTYRSVRTLFGDASNMISTPSDVSGPIQPKRAMSTPVFSIDDVVESSTPATKPRSSSASNVDTVRRNTRQDTTTVSNATTATPSSRTPIRRMSISYSQLSPTRTTSSPNSHVSSSSYISSNTLTTAHASSTATSSASTNPAHTITSTLIHSNVGNLKPTVNTAHNSSVHIDNTKSTSEQRLTSDTSSHIEVPIITDAISKPSLTITTSTDVSTEIQQSSSFQNTRRKSIVAESSLTSIVGNNTSSSEPNRLNVSNSTFTSSALSASVESNNIVASVGSALNIDAAISTPSTAVTSATHSSNATTYKTPIKLNIQLPDPHSTPSFTRSQSTTSSISDDRQQRDNELQNTVSVVQAFAKETSISVQTHAAATPTQIIKSIDSSSSAIKQGRAPIPTEAPDVAFVVRTHTPVHRRRSDSASQSTPTSAPSKQSSASKPLRSDIADDPTPKVSSVSQPVTPKPTRSTSYKKVSSSYVDSEVPFVCKEDDDEAKDRPNTPSYSSSSSRTPTSEGRSRRASVKSYAEPSLRDKLRKGDDHTFTIESMRSKKIDKENVENQEERQGRRI